MESNNLLVWFYIHYKTYCCVSTIVVTNTYNKICKFLKSTSLECTPGGVHALGVVLGVCGGRRSGGGGGVEGWRRRMKKEQRRRWWRSDSRFAGRRIVIMLSQQSALACSDFVINFIYISKQ